MSDFTPWFKIHRWTRLGSRRAPYFKFRAYTTFFNVRFGFARQAFVLVIAR